MKQKTLIFSALFIILAILTILIIFVTEDISNGNDISVQKDYSITTLQKYDSSLCSSSSNEGGYTYVGFKLRAYDAETGKPIKIKREGFAFLGQPAGGGTPDYNDRFRCYLIDPKYPFSVSVVADGYIPIEGMNIGSVPGDKMYLVKVNMQKKPTCYYDEQNLEKYYDYIEKGFGLKSNQYTLNCMDSDITRGGFIEAKGNHNKGGNFELLYRWGWCSSGGADCGWTKCFSVEGNDELFEDIKSRMCNEIRSQGYNDGTICTSPAYDNSKEIRQKCLDGRYEYSIGNKKIISIIQGGGRCLSSVTRGKSDCLSMY